MCRSLSGTVAATAPPTARHRRLRRARRGVRNVGVGLVALVVVGSVAGLSVASSCSTASLSLGQAPKAAAAAVATAMPSPARWAPAAAEAAQALRLPAWLLDGPEALSRSIRGTAPEPPPQEPPRVRRMRRRRGKERPLRHSDEPIPPAIAKQLDQAAAFFSNSVRIPAVLIAGKTVSIINGLLVRAESPVVEQLPAGFVALWRMHILLMGYTLCAQLTAVLVCSSAHAQLLDISRDELQLEPTALDLINRHLELEYVLVHVAFFSGLVAFLLGTMARAIATLGAHAPRCTSCISGRSEREFCLCLALCGMIVATLCLWLHIWGETMPSSMEFLGLILRLWQLMGRDLRYSNLGKAATLFAASSAVFSLMALRVNTKYEAQDGVALLVLGSNGPSPRSALSSARVVYPVHGSGGGSGGDSGDSGGSADGGDGGDAGAGRGDACAISRIGRVGGGGGGGCGGSGSAGATGSSGLFPHFEGSPRAS
eukprot:NODE_4537_length_1880_cov_4.139190.p1 GENE.NODE_4537_length_1880_cov_4.139190~~NODE_4537_length_1880_cov_4.139190.p1  ORF type:complete len:484 (+),score=153.30 NODE_4537_length_1880_cov_4.139190:82-1533(+)